MCFQAFQQTLAIALMFIMFRWDMAGYLLRYWWNGLCLVGIFFSFRKVRGKEYWDPRNGKIGWGKIFEIVLLTAGIIWLAAGMYPNKEPVSMSFPLKGDSYFVANGGDEPLLNYHSAAVASQTYALDINRLNSWGFRADGVLPTELD